MFSVNNIHNTSMYSTVIYKNIPEVFWTQYLMYSEYSTNKYLFSNVSAITVNYNFKNYCT